MTEAEWLVSDSLERMWGVVSAATSLRKARLFAASVLGEQKSYPDPDTLYLERIADNEKPDEDPVVMPYRAAWALADSPDAVMTEVFSYVADWRRNCRNMIEVVVATSHCIIPNENQAWFEPVLAERFANYLREVFGNPFRPVEFDPAWRTTDVLLLARGIYESREFGAMPILADALQDAGCDNEAILGHLRDVNATHVRGCWALDLVLEKE